VQAIASTSRPILRNHAPRLRRAEGHRTVIATPEGHVFINPTGNAGMATGGTGDVFDRHDCAWVAQLLDARRRAASRSS